MNTIIRILSFSGIISASISLILKLNKLFTYSNKETALERHEQMNNPYTNKGISKDYLIETASNFGLLTLSAGSLMLFYLSYHKNKKDPENVTAFVDDPMEDVKEEKKEEEKVSIKVSR